MSDKSEKNRKIAEFVGLEIVECQRGTHVGTHCLIHREASPPYSPFHRPLPDFYTSEEASALVLDAFIEHNRKVLGSLEEAWKHTGNRIGYFMAQNGITDRKEAIAEAALRLIETGGQRT